MRKFYILICFSFCTFLVNAQEIVDTSEANIKGKFYKSVNHRIGGKLIKSYLYNKDGNLFGELRFVNDKCDGVSTFYYTDGSISERITYSNNMLEGPVTLYYKSGEVSREGFHHKNLREGKWTYYYFGTNIKSSEEQYKNNKLDGVRTYFYKSGKIYSTAMHKDNKRDGEVIVYYESGNVEFTGEYKNNHMEGGRLYYNKDGQLFNGNFSEYYNDSTTQIERTVKCINGKPEGELKLYRKNGIIQSAIDFKDGLPEGKAIYYDKQHKVIRTEYYKKGKFVKEEKAIKEDEPD